MGNAAATLTSLQSAEITRQLKLEYEKCVKEGLDDEAATALLCKKYESTLRKVQASPLDIITSNAKRLKRGTSKAVENGKATIKKRNSMDAKPKATSRHKSFEEKPVKPAAPNATRKKSISKTEGIGEKLEQSESAPEIAPPQEEELPPPQSAPQESGDSWDSVKGQPACLLCGMVFPSVEKLNTHTKYSSLHASNLKRLEEKAAAAEAGEDEESGLADPSSRCRVLYTGSKFYWRTKENVDINIYLHTAEKCVEIIGYHNENAIELPRLYVDEGHAVGVVGEGNIQEKVEARQESENVGSMSGKSHVLKLIYEEEKRLAIASLLVARLQLGSVENGGISTKGLVLVASGAGEAITALPQKPDSLVPVRVKRRRHSSSEEINASMRTLSDMQNDLKTLTNNAERLVESINQGVKAFKGAMVISEKDGEEEISAAKQKWRLAIHKIVVRNGVAHTTEHLKKFGDRFLSTESL